MHNGETLEESARKAACMALEYPQSTPDPPERWKVLRPELKGTQKELLSEDDNTNADCPLLLRNCCLWIASKKNRRHIRGRIVSVLHSYFSAASRT